MYVILQYVLCLYKVTEGQTEGYSKNSRFSMRFLGAEELLAPRCPCCGATERTQTRGIHTQLCHRPDAQVNQHKQAPDTYTLRAVPIV